MKKINLTELIIDERFPEQLKVYFSELRILQLEMNSLVRKQRYEEAVVVRNKEKKLWEELNLKIDELEIVFDIK